LEANNYNLTTEAVDSLALALKGVDDVEGGDGLPASVLAVGHGVPDDVLQELLQDATDLLVDTGGNALHTTTTSEAADSGLGDALDVIAKDLAMTLSATLAKAFATFTTTGHFAWKLTVMLIERVLRPTRGEIMIGRSN
jgi:hypothetical protein